MTTLPPRPQKAALLVAQQIVSDIQDRGNVVGDRLPTEKVMLEQYQIGRGTLRESLRYLELQGLISLKPGPGGGPVVEKANGSGITNSLMLLLQMENAPYRTIVEARGGIEPAMTRLAAVRVTEEQLAEIEDNLGRMLAGINDEAVFAQTNQEFHDLVARASGNALYAHLIDALTGILDGTTIGIEYPRHRRVAVHEAHSRIYQALRQGDPVDAADAMREHIAEYTKYIERKYAQVVEAPIRWS